ncbi:hypothetical protein ANO11243_069350 [Dothideomycetidae sp. 11243]|nr:hypothetical protein ANO11243_069350 [fungal sp. No.11243]
MAETFKGPAIVARKPLPENGWVLEDLTLTADIEDNEVVVQMVAGGVCHTDILHGSIPPGYPMAAYPRVLGHEGSGYVRKVGNAVKSVSVGDPVLLSFSSCGSCSMCNSKKWSYCYSFGDLNVGDKPTFTDSGGKPVIGRYFGQSSFASFSVVRESSLVNVRDLISDKKELELSAPLGCGMQTGAAAVINVAKVTEQDVVVVSGMGGVGLSAIMAAAMSKARMIVGVDRVESRLQLAKELGATHTVNSAKLEDGKTLVESIMAVCEGEGPHVFLEATGVPEVIKASIQAVRQGGAVYQIGVAPPDFNLEIPSMYFMVQGKTYRGVMVGDALPKKFVPQMIGWYREGKFPIDRLITHVPAREFQRALKGMHDGSIVKPVLLW